MCVYGPLKHQRVMYAHRSVDIENHRYTKATPSKKCSYGLANVGVKSI